MRTAPLTAALLTATLALPAAAQAGWTVRPDEGGTPAEVKVETMPPGWHLTSGPASILYRPADTASGQYTVTAKLHLFPGTGAHEEAFGLFIGGRDLGGAGQRYTYFLIRGDGSWKVKLRRGAAATDVGADWQKSAAIVPGKPGGPVANVLSLAVAQDRVRFLVNGTEVWSGPRAAIEATGVAGVRLNHNLSVHLETFAIMR